MYMWRESDQVSLGVSCFKIHSYILGYTTAYKYIKPIIYQLADTENQDGEKKEDCKGQRWKGSRTGLGYRNDIA